MKMMELLGLMWHCWCDLWRLNWDEVADIDSHKWDSKMEMRARLSCRRR